MIFHLIIGVSFFSFSFQDLKDGLTNGSRLISKPFFEIISGHHRGQRHYHRGQRHYHRGGQRHYHRGGQRHYLPKMMFQPSDSGFPFVLKRINFPV